MQSDQPLSTTLRAARGRYFFNRLLSELGFAVALAAALFCALLLAGVHVLSGVPLLLLALLMVAVLAWRLRGAWLAEYEVAQSLDRRFGLPDTLSTAWHYEQPQTMADTRWQRLQPMVQRQQQEAAEALARVAVGEAYPMAWSRLHLAAMLLCVVAVALVGWRYFNSDSLSFGEQLASMRIPFVDGSEEPPLMLADEAYAPLQQEKEPSPLEQYQPEYDPGRERLDGTYNDMPPISGISVNDEEGGQSGDSDGAESESASDMRSQIANDPRRQQGAASKDGKQRGEGDKKPGDKKGETLFDKFQQAMNNMVDKMMNRETPQMDQRGEKQQSEAKNQGNQQGDGQDDSSNREGNQRNENAQANDNAKEGMGGKNAKDTNQQTNAGANEKAADAPSSVGAEDGDKELAAARQLEAMGKIAEIFGQRAEQVKGEMKVEVQAQKEQTLSTQLRNVRAERRDGGSEMTRDEVPLRLQNYVKEYMKAARQVDAPAAATPAGSATAPASRNE